MKDQLNQLYQKKINFTTSLNNINNPAGRNAISNGRGINDFNNWRFFYNGQLNTEPITMTDVERYINYLSYKADKNMYESNLVKNFNIHKSDLLQDNTYHKQLTPEDVLKEFDLMSAEEIPISSNTYPNVSDFFKHDALPRLLDSFKRSGVVLQPDDIDYINNLYSNPFNGVDIAIGYDSPGSAGYSLGTNFIRFSNRFNSSPELIGESTIVHELHHSLRDRLAKYLTSKGYNINEGQDWLPEVLESGTFGRNNNIRNNYLPSELEIMKPLAMDRKYTLDKTPVAEIGAVSAGNARFRYWNQIKKQLGRTPTVEEVNKRLDEISSQKLYWDSKSLSYGTQIGSVQDNAFNAFEHDIYRRANLTNAIRNTWYTKLPWYKKLFVKEPEPLLPNLYKERLAHERSMGDAWKDAMKYIAGVSGVTAGAINTNNQIENKQY